MARVTVVSSAAIGTCPFLILAPSHYIGRENGPCRCDDPAHSEMVEWGYTWDAKKGVWAA